MKGSLGEKVFWTVIALSSIGAAAFGYHRFKLIRPDLFGKPQAVTLPEDERKARIAEYQQKGDTLSRAAAIVREPKTGERCDNGIIVRIAPDAGGETRPVIANEQPVRCPAPPAPPAP